MADPAHTHDQAYKADARLHELGLSAEDLREAVGVGLAARRSATAFHPPSYPGLMQWAETHRALRERLVRSGWTADDTGGFSTILSPSRAVAITVATGSDRTGSRGWPEPTTKYPRGPLTHAAIDANQLVIPGFPGVVAGGQTESNGCVTWVLLVHVRHDECRFELSCPAHVGEDGRVDAWSERILIGGIDSASFDFGDDDGVGPAGAIDVPVEPR
jgi:hypothetical protein